MDHLQQHDDDEHIITRPLRVPLHQMDAVQRSIRDSTLSDLDSLRALRDQAYLDRERDDCDAWRHNSNGRQQQHQDQHQQDVLNPCSPRFNLDAARAARRAAYEAYDREQENAWRHDAYNLKSHG